jgi:hypothetical protein
MTDEELLDAYRQALRNYEAAKADNGNRVEAFVQFMSAEIALSRRLGPDMHTKLSTTTIEYDQILRPAPWPPG